MNFRSFKLFIVVLCHKKIWINPDFVNHLDSSFLNCKIESILKNHKKLKLNTNMNNLVVRILN